MSNLENASLVLRTADLPAGSSTTLGSCDAFNTSFTWNNINMRTLLGTMYDKYDTFNLCLSSITTEIAVGSFGYGLIDRIAVINVGGLPFVNNTYNTGLKCNTTTAVLGTFTFVANQSTSQFFYSSNVATFGKNQDVCNISINYTRIIPNGAGTYVTQNSATAANVFPNVVFIFDIFGIDKEAGNQNGTRISFNG